VIALSSYIVIVVIIETSSNRPSITGEINLGPKLQCLRLCEGNRGEDARRATAESFIFAEVIVVAS
jgi:hypothetical protein